MNSKGKDFSQVMQTRRSVRGFLPDKVPHKTLNAIFEMAQSAPSNCNVQPWQVYVASGEQCDLLRSAMLLQAKNNAPSSPYFGKNPAFKNQYRQRQVECAYALYNTIGVERGDKAGRDTAMLRNFCFFDAPHVAFIGMPKHYGHSNALDVGIYVQTLLLCMQYHGVSSCAQGALAFYPDVVREVFGYEDSIGLLLGISFGYEDTTAVVNQTRTSRAILSECVIFKE